MPSNLFKIKKIEPQIISKGWGHEEVIANEHYCGKLLVFKQEGYEGSMHYHVLKLEHFRILSGEFSLKCIDPTNASEYTIELKEGDVVEIPVGQPHRIICVKKGAIMEVSTRDNPEDSYRVQKGDSQREIIPKLKNKKLRKKRISVSETVVREDDLNFTG